MCKRALLLSGADLALANCASSPDELEAQKKLVPKSA